MDETVLGQQRVKIVGGLLEHKPSGSSLHIDTEPRLVGRGEACHLRLDDRRVSTAHCQLAASDRGVIVRDCGSKNGTWIGEGAVLGANQFAVLRRATTIRVGETVLQFTPRDGEEKELPASFGFLESRSTRMRQVLEQVRKLAMITAPVHITGESGTGKSHLARAIHNAGGRASKPFVVIDCAGIAPNLVEGELFGYEKGAFTGATHRKESPFVEADGGTVFLDEVGDLSLEMQARLLRVVEEQEVKSIGQNQYRKVDVRVISATLRNLAEHVNTGQFREDLYYRLTAASIELPPLRERKEDIEILARSILAELGMPDALESVSPETVAWMKEQAWTKGNVRQLRQVLKLAVDLSQGAPLDIQGAWAMNRGAEQVRARAATETKEETAYDALTARGTQHEAVMMEANRIFFGKLVRETNGNVAEICRRTGLSRDYARELLETLGLRKIQPPRTKKD